MASPKAFIFVTVTLAVMNLLFINYDSSLCPSVEAQSYNYTQLNASTGEAFEKIRETECAGIPNWVKLIVNAPFLVAAFLAMLP